MTFTGKAILPRETGFTCEIKDLQSGETFLSGMKNWPQNFFRMGLGGERSRAWGWMVPKRNGPVKRGWMSVGRTGSDRQQTHTGRGAEGFPTGVQRREGQGVVCWSGYCRCLPFGETNRLRHHPINDATGFKYTLTNSKSLPTIAAI